MIHARKLSQIPLHPFLFGVFPILSLLGLNILEIAPRDSLRPVFFSVALITILLVLFWLVHRDWHRAAIVATIFIIFFFSYGHVYNLVKQMTLGGIPLGRHRFLALIWLVILITGWWWAKTTSEIHPVTRALNLVGVFLLVYPALQVSSSMIQTLTSRPNNQEVLRNENAPQLFSGKNYPDIYYIIPDAYTRDDTLLDFYGFDNTAFLTALEARGFYVARCSQSNYARTFLSLSSSLNMDYIQALSPANESDALTTLIKQSLVRRKLEALGYTIIAFDAGYYRTQWPDADRYLSYLPTDARRLIGINEFETILIETTAIRLLLDGDIAFGRGLLEFVYESSRLERYNRTMYILDNLNTIATLPSPKFVFAHIPVPHEPYIFSVTGEFLPDQEAYIPGYPDQVAYLNGRLLGIIDSLLATSESPPIIILQGDHGGGETKDDFRRMHILNAYYLPDGQESLYPTITPVNTFRILFDNFGENLGVLPDISYYSTPDKNFQFTVVPVSRSGCEQFK
jgi:hypothetical protein